MGGNSGHRTRVDTPLTDLLADDFPALMAEVRRIVPFDWEDRTTREYLNSALSQFEHLLSRFDGEPPLAIAQKLESIQQGFAFLKEQVERLEDQSKKHTEVSPSREPALDTTLCYLLLLNGAHAQRQGVAKEFERELKQLFASLLPKRRPGRPSKRSAEMAMEMHTLQKQGLSYQQVANKLGLTRQEVIDTLKYRYKPGKIS